MRSHGGVDKLPSNPHSAPGLADAAFKDVTHPKFSSHLLHVYGPTLVGEARIASDDEEPAHSRQRGDNLFNYAISEIVLVAIAAQVIEWENRDGRLLW